MFARAATLVTLLITSFTVALAAVRRDANAILAAGPVDVQIHGDDAGAKLSTRRSLWCRQVPTHPSPL